MPRPASIISIFLTLSCLGLLHAQEGSTFGGWEHMDLSHSFKNSNWYASLYFEHDNIRYQRLDLCFVSASFGYHFSKWLKASAAYDFMIEPAGIGHRAVAEVTGTLRKGNLSLSLRERYQHKWPPGASPQTNELRNRLKAQYAIPNSRLKPYLALEVYVWDKWLKSRHYAGTTVAINTHLELEAYYMYFLFADKPAEHVLGLGVNMAL